MANLTATELKVLRAFAEANGRNWRAQLRRLWATGKDDQQPEGAVLRRIRNSQVNRVS